MTAALLLIGVAGCAGIPYIAGETKAVKEQADLQTASNLVRRNKGSSGAREMVRDAIESALRGINANRGNNR